VDWRDRFVPPSELAAALGLEEGEFEERQCLCLNVAGGVLQAKQGSQPPVDEVLALAGDMRSDQWDRAQQAQAALGDAPPWVHSVEAELRRDCHDSGHKHHEKGYRSLRFFPPEFLQGCVIQVIRPGPDGRPRLDRLVGARAGEEAPHHTFLAWQRHLRSLTEPAPGAGRHLAAKLTNAGCEVRDFDALGWSVILEGLPQEAPSGARRACSLRSVQGARDACPGQHAG
jgi:hypothetical protein